MYRFYLFRDEISRSDLALVRLQYEIHNSPVPASFLCWSLCHLGRNSCTIQGTEAESKL